MKNMKSNAAKRVSAIAAALVLAMTAMAMTAAAASLPEGEAGTDVEITSLHEIGDGFDTGLSDSVYVFTAPAF